MIEEANTQTPMVADNVTKDYFEYQSLKESDLKKEIHIWKTESSGLERFHKLALLFPRSLHLWLDSLRNVLEHVCAQVEKHEEEKLPYDFSTLGAQ